MDNTTPNLYTGEVSALQTNKVLKNTYALLSMTLLFSAAMAALSVLLNAPFGLAFGANLVALGILFFVMPRVEDSSAGIGAVFAFTGLLGFGLGPLLNYYLGMPGGPAVVMTALAGTGAIFLALSGYALTTKKDFSFLGGFLAVGMIVVLGFIVLSLFVNMPAMELAISAAIVLLMSGLILFETSRIIGGGETNYIRATTSLFLSVLNLFTALLHLLGMGGDD